MVRHQQPRRDTVSNSPMHQTAFNGDLDELQDIIAIPDNLKKINVKNHLGCTPLRLAATSGNQACVALLITHGADVNVTDIKGQTPVFVAVKNNHPGCVRVLVRYGADPDGSPSCLSTPLYIAAMHGLVDCLQILIQAGADVNCFLTKGPYIAVSNTPLHISFTYRHQDCFKALLVGGADPDCGLTDKYLETCPSLLDAAIKWGDIYFVQLLVEFGGSLTKNNEHWKAKIASTKLTEKECEVRAYLTHVKSVPRCLQSLCRLAIRRSLGARRLTSVSSLPLPAYMKKYLQHCV